MTSNIVLHIAQSDVGKLDTTRAVKKLFQRIFKYVWQNKLPFFVALVVIICLSIMQVLIPQVTRYTIDVVIPTKQLNLLPWIAAAIFFISILTGVLNYARTYLMSLFGERIIDSIRNDMYKHIQGLSISFFENQRTGDLMSRLAKDVNTIGTLVTADIAEILVDVFTVIVIIVYLLTADWQLSLLLLFTWPLTIYMTQVFGKLMRGAYREVEEQAAAVNNHLQDTISNIHVIKSFGNERYEINRFFEQSRSYMEANIRATRLWSIFFPVIDVLNNIGSAIVLVFGSWEVIVGRLTIGELAAFLAYVYQVNRPIRRFSRMIQLVQRALVGSERVFEILEMEPEVKEKEDAVVLTSVEGNLKFENVEFGYQEGETVLHDFTLEIKPGMTVALVGSSGAGKSTVAKLAARFYDPQKGEILIDNRNLQDISLESLRSHLGIVSQETLLLYGTVRDNIAYGKIDATDAEIEAAAKAANAHDFIINFPEGYNSIIGERGVKLSGGQRQRLAIARILLKNPQFVILDEATSALDTESEQLIQESLQQLLKDRTSLVIAHRLSTIEKADKIVVLESGCIVETGTHPELIAKGGRYASLHSRQFPQKSSQLEPLDIQDKKLEYVS
ncbi:MAG: ABC transporter ATP-binding protein [Moorea sp. SIO4E2]|uniref:ABC transporter ATP-binding protein n=1 Tax=Moorena sp. SIO4E2 TaxID=2607826 RepID=UPI0013BE4A88|nr:ABC transporter ATP-binding protein [Moorena sp. SIO4E2]NEQ09157.1 ABC transporter ATP-binding protein [Moorena sp. SIO4E2]